MTPQKERKGPAWLHRILDLGTDPRVIALLLGAFGLGAGGGGLVMADSGESARIDTLEAEVGSLKQGFKQMQRNQLEMHSAQIEADTALKAILEDRAANRRKAAEARAETEKLFNDITGGTP